MFLIKNTSFGSIILDANSLLIKTGFLSVIYEVNTKLNTFFATISFSFSPSLPCTSLNTAFSLFLASSWSSDPLLRVLGHQTHFQDSLLELPDPV